MKLLIACAFIVALAQAQTYEYARLYFVTDGRWEFATKDSRIDAGQPWSFGVEALGCEAQVDDEFVDFLNCLGGLGWQLITVEESNGLSYTFIRSLPETMVEP